MKRDQLSECGGCGAPERFFLHNLRHRASYRRLCTNCVLKNHQGLFCPICLEVFNEPPPPHQRLICLKCPSISHLSCPSSHLSQSFTCPLCSNPNFSFFSLADEKPKSTPDNPQGSTPEEDGDDDAGGKNDDKTSTKTRVINKEAAKALLAAAKIAAVSMTKAAAVAKLEAERRVKEATLAKKRAKEALERLALLVRKDNDRHKSSLISTLKSKADAAVSAATTKTNSLSLPSHIPEKGNNGSFSVSAANVPKLHRQHSTHGMPN